MFEGLTGRFEKVFRYLRGQGKLTESNIKEALREVRVALLEADVHYRVVKDFIRNIEERAIGQEVLASLTAGQQVIKIVNEELTKLLGGQVETLHLSAPPPVTIMLLGLQGSGKTTTAAKLALKLKKEGRNPGLVPADVYRPAAVEQLTVLGNQIDVPVYPSDTNQTPEVIVKDALQYAKKHEWDTLIIDTAGRLHIDQELMEELKNLKAIAKPLETILVVDAMTGQDAVKVSESFNEALNLTGVILTKLDGDARGGAALSIKSVTGCPIKLVGTGEKLDALEVFYPDRMSSRILGMGDILTIIEKAQETIDEEEAKKLAKKFREDSFNLEDFRDQIRQIKKLGSLEKILSLLPGMGMLREIKNAKIDPKEFARVEAIINSMTKEERKKPEILNASRKLRIAKGSGTTVQDINKLIKSFEEIRKMMKHMRDSAGIKPIGSGRKKKKKKTFFPF